MNGELYDRQRRLREVGSAGQARIERSIATIAAGPSAVVELAYLVRAGVERASIIAQRPADFEHDSWFRFSSSRAVAVGATGALRHLLRALGES